VSIPEDDWAQATKLLGDCAEVVLACHVAPDGDALGSMIALGGALRRRGCRVIASWGSAPFEVPQAYGFLSDLDLLVPVEVGKEAVRLGYLERSTATRRDDQTAATS